MFCCHRSALLFITKKNLQLWHRTEDQAATILPMSMMTVAAGMAIELAETTRMIIMAEAIHPTAMMMTMTGISGVVITTRTKVTMKMSTTTIMTMMMMTMITTFRDVMM